MSLKRNIERGGKTPTPKASALLRKRPVLPRANFVLTKDRKRPYYGHFCGRLHREGSCSKAARVPSKVQMLNLVLGVGSFLRDGPNTTTTIISKNVLHLIKTAIDGTSDEKYLWFLCAPLCRKAFGASSEATPKRKMAPREMNSKIP